VTGTVLGSSTATYTYDAAGNRRTGPGMSIDYTAFHLPKRIQRGMQETLVRRATEALRRSS
jgi:hypothetical protein